MKHAFSPLQYRLNPQHLIWLKNICLYISWMLSNVLIWKLPVSWDLLYSLGKKLFLASAARFLLSNALAKTSSASSVFVPIKAGSWDLLHYTNISYVCIRAKIFWLRYTLGSNTLWSRIGLLRYRKVFVQMKSNATSKRFWPNALTWDQCNL